MNSINANQPEDNLKPLQGEEAVKKIKELVNKAQTCFFCTRSLKGSPINTRPMSTQKVDDDGTLWFVSASDSNMNRELMADPHAQLLYQGSPHSDFLSIYVTTTISTDRALIKELWEPIMKTWFTEGENDPRITVIKAEVVEGYYWDTKHGKAVALVKMIAGAIIGKTLDDSVEGKLRV